MRTVAILGAGPLGSALAETLSARQLVPEVLLLDESAPLAAARADDISQAASIAASDVRVSAPSDLREAVAAADLVIVADHATAPQHERSGEAALADLRRLLAGNREAPVIFAGATHGWLIVRSVVELQLGARRAVGSAPLALAAAIRSLVAADLDLSANDVLVTLVGTLPDRLLVLWDHATIAGAPLRDRLSPTQLTRLASLVPRLWPPGPYALAAAGAAVATAMATRSARTLPCFVALTRAIGAGRFAGVVPVRLDAHGVTALDVPPLGARERIALGPLEAAFSQA